jgi:glycolate oxidase FAD binding subunit
MSAWAAQPIPISATAHVDGTLFVRLSGSENGLRSARKKIGGDELANTAFWTDLREHKLSFFNTESVWRLSLAAATPMLDLAGDWLLEWGGALRWLKAASDGAAIRAEIERHGGHAAQFRGGDRQHVFHPLNPILFKLHQNLKQAFDPEGIFNPGRMYADL